MTTHFSANDKKKKFSIDDAFEEETDEVIKVYGGVIPKSPSNNLRNECSEGRDHVNVMMDNGRSFKVVNDTSRDSDSLIQDYYEYPSDENLDHSCLRHPKVRENWRMVAAAVALLIIGLGLLITGSVTLAEPNSGLQSSVFLLAGFICFLPGAYHVVYIYLAAKGKRGYHFHNLPLFT